MLAPLSPKCNVNISYLPLPPPRSSVCLYLLHTPPLTSFPFPHQQHQQRLRSGREEAAGAVGAGCWYVRWTDEVKRRDPGSMAEPRAAAAAAVVAVNSVSYEWNGGSITCKGAPALPEPQPAAAAAAVAVKTVSTEWREAGRREA
ncbi:unnamed protein product [Closterium sp. NIES-65]|nr:unnamed protein product [Closterium sp. NIES-65]